ncbi:MAG: hypothetical protein V1725_00250 [archaeon]
MVDAQSDEYELLPHEELEKLRKELDSFKKDPLGGMGSSKTLIEAMDNLSRSMNNLLNLLNQTQNDLIKEYEGQKPQEKLSRILDQNEKMARALVAIADMVKNQQAPPMPQMSQPQMQRMMPRQMAPPMRTFPPPDMPPPPPSPNLPPLPPPGPPPQLGAPPLPPEPKRRFLGL